MAELLSISSNAEKSARFLRGGEERQKKQTIECRFSYIISIRLKLDPHELVYLKDSFGVELRDPETVALLAEVSAAARELEKIEQRHQIKGVSGEPPHCSFCGQSSHVVGPMAQATTRALICRARYPMHCHH